MNRRNFVKSVVAGAAAASTWNARSYAAVQGANERLRLGVIGCGSMANSHMNALLEMKSSDNIEVVAVCDVYQKRLDAAAQKTGGKPFPRYQDLLAQNDIDYVLIATPEHWHHRMILDTIDAGKHVYVEKPMTHSIEQAKEVVHKVKDSNVKLQVGVQGMSDESYEVAEQYIREGALGTVVMAQIDYSRNYLGDFWAGPIDEDAKPGVNLDWEAWLGPAPKRQWDPRRYFQWRRYWDYSGGIATDLFIHRVSRIIKAVGLDFPDRVVATGGTWHFTDSVAEIPETFNMLCDYPGGPTVALISSMANDTPIDHVIRGHKATLEFTHDGFVITPQEATSEDAINPQDRRAGEVCLQVYRKRGAEDVTLHHRNLQQAIRQGQELKCDAQLGYHGVVVTMMGVESFRNRDYLRWNREKEIVEQA
ncbi:MAG: Gfo/Idh/MocA family protein [Acidobacteriota bacterium]